MRVYTVLSIFVAISLIFAGIAEAQIRFPDGSSQSTAFGGENSTVSGANSAVTAGLDNEATANEAFVGGGYMNVASGERSIVVGGYENTALDDGSVVIGGRMNSAGGFFATVLGGNQCVADGDLSFAAGNGARVSSLHVGAFVFSDSLQAFFDSTASREFAVRATGGVRFVSAINGVGTPTAGVRLNPGSSSWAGLSDRNAKENFEEVDGKEVLAKVAGMPIGTWNYKTQEASIRHMGPVAQDFYAAFGVGADERHITTIDADGVALAAIQGLNEIIEEKDARLRELEERNRALEARIEAIEAALLKNDPDEQPE